ncbi:hypothetical protein VNO78_17814 [Psophocarpus tetragonolobus]|uniref:Uncharacterized protein n=1 Tax=Psophocarpus tetragonolobus TaxID=3891 RepID=A0AAN9XLH8_PSOTE
MASPLAQKDFDVTVECVHQREEDGVNIKGDETLRDLVCKEARLANASEEDGANSTEECTSWVGPCLFKAISAIAENGTETYYNVVYCFRFRSNPVHLILMLALPTNTYAYVQHTPSLSDEHCLFVPYISAALNSDFNLFLFRFESFYFSAALDFSMKTGELEEWEEKEGKGKIMGYGRVVPSFVALIRILSYLSIQLPSPFLT